MDSKLKQADILVNLLKMSLKYLGKTEEELRAEAEQLVKESGSRSLAKRELEQKIEENRSDEKQKIYFSTLKALVPSIKNASYQGSLTGLGNELMDWHSGPGSAVYRLGSNLSSGKNESDVNLVNAALQELTEDKKEGLAIEENLIASVKDLKDSLSSKTAKVKTAMINSREELIAQVQDRTLDLDDLDNAREVSEYVVNNKDEFSRDAVQWAQGWLTMYEEINDMEKGTGDFTELDYYFNAKDMERMLTGSVTASVVKVASLKEELVQASIELTALEESLEEAKMAGDDDIHNVEEGIEDVGKSVQAAVDQLDESLMSGSLDHEDHATLLEDAKQIQARVEELLKN